MPSDLHLRRLTVSDLPQVRDLLDADPGYAHRVTGSGPAEQDAADLLAGAPPELRPDQKTLFGAVDGRGLVAVVDVLRGWPDPATVHIGLLQVHAGRKREGIGRRTHDLLLDQVAQWPEITTFRAAVLATNAEHAEPFWAALDYRPTEPPKPYRIGTQVTQVTAWTRPARPVASTDESTSADHETRTP